MTPAFRNNAKPLDHHAGLLPMSAEDEAYWQSRHDTDFNPRTERRLFVVVLGGMAIVLIGCWLGHGSLAA